MDDSDMQQRCWIYHAAAPLAGWKAFIEVFSFHWKYLNLQAAELRIAGNLFFRCITRPRGMAMNWRMTPFMQ